MAAQFAKPENALKRAEEYINVGDKNTALQTLHSVLGSKRFQLKDKPSVKIFEKIMMKYLDLCIELRRGKMAKDGLHQFKYTLKTNKGGTANQIQQTPSLETVIRHFIAGAEKAVKDAQSKSDEIVAEIDDLDEAPAAEALLISAVQREDARGRTDRQVVTPWLKFLWETYRTVLEFLRNNPKLEHLYAYTAQQAFSFCQTYNRKIEFRRLAETLRNHLQGLSKTFPGQQQPQQPGVTLSNPETAQLLLEIRFAQLNVATQMELWQESFRSVEDVHNLMLQSKRSPSPEMMCIYYERLIQIFWQAKNFLFHSYSCIKYFNLLRKLKHDISEAQVAALASQVLLSALSIPISENDDDSEFGFDFDVQKEKNFRLATLLGFNSPVPRNTLIADLVEKDLLKLIYPELSGIYQTLERSASPLSFGNAMSQYLTFIKGREELKVYAQTIAANAFRRLLQAIAPLYETIKITRLHSLAKFVEPSEVERMIVEGVRDGLFEARIDHQIGVVRFQSEKLEFNDLKSQLSTISSRLEESACLISPAAKQQQLLRKQKVFARVMSGLEEEHQSILVRKAFIEKRKEAEEEKNRRKALELEEKARLEAEAQQRAAEREAEEKKKLQEQIQEKLRKAKLEQAKKDVEEEKDVQEHVRQRVQKLREEKEDMEKRLKKLVKRLDHLERARREEEKPLLEELFQKKLMEDKKYHDEQIRKFLDDHKTAYVQKLSEKKRLVNILPHKAEFEEIVTNRRFSEYEVKKKEQDEEKEAYQTKLNVALEKQAALKAKREEMEKRKRFLLEEEKRKEEEEKAKRRAQEEERAQEERERKEKLERQAEAQRRRVREIEEKEERRGVNVQEPVRKPEEKKWGRTVRDEQPRVPREDAEPSQDKWVPRSREGSQQSQDKWVPRSREGSQPSQDKWAPRSREESQPSQEKWTPKSREEGGGQDKWGRGREEPQSRAPRSDANPSEGKWKSNREESSGVWRPGGGSSRAEEGGWKTQGRDTKGDEGRWGRREGNK